MLAERASFGVVQFEVDAAERGTSGGRTHNKASTRIRSGVKGRRLGAE